MDYKIVGFGKGCSKLAGSCRRAGGHLHGTIDVLQLRLG